MWEWVCIVNGVRVASQGVSPGANDGGGPGNREGVGLHWPIAVLPTKGGGLEGKRPSFERSVRISAAAWAPTAVPGSRGSMLFAARKFAYAVSSVTSCAGKRPASTSWPDAAVAARSEPVAPGPNEWFARYARYI